MTFKLVSSRSGALCAALFAALALAACASGGGQQGDGASALSDQKGADALVVDGSPIVRIVEVDRSKLASQGSVRYLLENVSGENQEQLSYAVQFLLPSTGSGKVRQAYDTEFVLPQPLRMYTDDPAPKWVEAQSKAWGGGKILGTRIVVEKERPTLTAGTDEVPDDDATTFMGGLLKCRSVQGAFASPQFCEFTVKNVSAQTVGGLDVQLVMLDSDQTTPLGETDWQPLPDAARGAEVSVAIDLSTYSGTKTSRNYWIRIRQGLGF